MTRDGVSGISRRTALKLAGGSLVTAGGIGTATAASRTTRCGRLDTPQYVVHAVLDTEKPATGLRRYISKAVADLNIELGIDADLRYEQRFARPESLGLTPERIHPSADQVQAFDAIRENLPGSDFLASVKSGIDEDVTLDDLYFVFVHNNGSLSMSGQWGSASFAAKRGAAFPGWGQSNPVEHDVVDGETLDMILFGPTGGLDNAGIAEEVAGYGEWREQVLSYQAVGHALGAHHHHGGYEVDATEETIERVSVMAAGHVLDRKGQYDIEESLDNWPWAPSAYLATEDDGTLRTTDNGCLVFQREPGAEEHVSCAYLDYRFHGWGGGEFPELDAELPLEDLSDEERKRRDLEEIHPLTYTDAAKSAVVGTLKRRGLAASGDRKIDPAIGITDPVSLGPGKPLRLDGSETSVGVDTAATVYEWRVWPRGAPRGDEHGFGNVIHAYGETAEISYEELERHFLDDGEEIVVQLNVFAVPAGESVGGSESGASNGAGSDDGTSVGDALRELVQRDTEAGGTQEIPDRGCRTDEWEDVLFNRTQIGPVATSVASGPEPAFSFAPESPRAGETVMFDASPTENPGGGALVSYRWEFEGPTEPFPGSTAEDAPGARTVGPDDTPDGLARTAEQTFEHPGTYEVRLAVTNQTGITRETTEQFTVRPRDAVAGRIEGPGRLAPGESGEYSLDVTAAADREDGRFEYDWHVHRLDGEDRAAEMTTGDGPSLTVAPERTGRYELSVTVEELREITIPTSGGETTIEVEGERVEPITESTTTVSRTIVVNEPPEVEVRAERERIPPGSTGTFTAAVTNADPGDSYSYTWFGSAAIAGTTREVSARFDEVGDLTVGVTVTDRFGETGTDTLTVEVEDPAEEPEVHIRGPDEPEAGDRVKYGARVTGAEGSLTYEWNVGSGSGAFVFPTFDSTGQRTVELTVTDERGYDATATKTVEVVEPDPPASAFREPDSGPTPDGPIRITNDRIGVEFDPVLNRQYADTFLADGQPVTASSSYFPRDGSSDRTNKYVPQALLDVQRGSRQYTIDRRYVRADKMLDISATVRIPDDGRVGIVSLTYENAGDVPLTVDTPDFFIADGTPVGRANLSDPTGTYRYHVSGGPSVRFADDGGWSSYTPSGTVPFVTAFDDETAVTVGLLQGDTGLEMAFTNNGGSTAPADDIRLHVAEFSLAPGETSTYTLATGVHRGGADAPTTAASVMSVASRRAFATVDDFERSSPLAAYRNPDSANWTLGTGHTSSGDHNLRLDDTHYSDLYSFPGEGLPLYPRPGDRFGGTMGGDADNVGVIFGIPTGSYSNRPDGYMLRASPFNDAVELYRNELDAKVELDRAAAPIRRGETYRASIDWGTDGTITATLTRNGSTLGTVSAADSTYGAGGFGYRAGDFEAPVEAWYDDWRLL